MEAQGLKRYKKKLELIDLRRRQLSKWLKDEKDEKTKLAVYKAFQEIVEALFDLIAMKLKDSKKLPEDDYANIVLLEQEGFLAVKEASALREINGLRNRLVHEYSGLSDSIAFNSIKESLGSVFALQEKIAKWLANKN